MMPVLLWIAIVYLLTLKQYSKRPIASGQPVLDSVKESLAQVEHQIWFMRSLLWWNLLPVAVTLLAYSAHATWEMTLPWWGRVLVIGSWAFLLYHALRWMSRMNELSVQKELEPRRSDLKKIIRNLESDNSEDEHQMQDIVFGLTETDGRAELRLRSRGAEVWNRIVPSWREVALLVVPTLLIAYGACQVQLDFMKPIIFQSACAACITFTIAFFSLCFLSHRRHKGQPLSGSDDMRYNAPAIVTIALIVLMLILNFAAFLSHASEVKSPQIKSDDTGAPANANSR